MSDPNAKPPPSGTKSGPDSTPSTAPAAPDVAVPDIAARAAAAEPMRDGKPATPGPKPAATPAAGRPGTQSAGGAPRPAAAPPGASSSPPSSHATPAARRAGAVLTALAVAVLAGGLAWVWSEQQQAARTAVAPADVAALREQMRTLQQRLAQLEQRPTPAATPAPPPAVDLRPLESRVAALEQRPTAQPAPAGPDPAVTERLATLDDRLAKAEQAASRAGQEAASRTARLARLQAAAAALEAGRPLGEIPSAPSALARFAAVAPPTEAALRLAFPDAAQQARAASRTAEADQGVGARIWQRVRNLVTIREGDTVLLGAPAATVLGQAQARLNAGDLAGAVAALDGLDPEAAAAIGEWRGRAEALLAARAALAGMLAA